MHWAKRIVIQADNAKPHTAQVGLCLQSRINKRRHPIKIIFKPQPAQSPDTNANDLGFYPSLSRKAAHPRGLLMEPDEIVDRTVKAFKNYSVATLEKIFDTKKRVLKRIVACKGDNLYDIRHD